MEDGRNIQMSNKTMTNEELTILLLELISIHNKFVDNTIHNINVLEDMINNKCICITDIRLKRQ